MAAFGLLPWDVTDAPAADELAQRSDEVGAFGDATVDEASWCRLSCADSNDRGGSHALVDEARAVQGDEPSWLASAELLKPHTPCGEWTAPFLASEPEATPAPDGEIDPSETRDHERIDGGCSSSPVVLANTASSPPSAAAPSPDRYAYLERARNAALAHYAAQQPQKSGLLGRLQEERVGALSLSAGAAALLLLGGAMLTHDAENGARAATAERGETTASVVAALDQREQAPDYLADYEASQQLIADGRVEEGVRLLSRAAAGGLPLAQYRLSKRYEIGDGVPRNLALALAWAERAARAGNVRAMHDVGVYMARGEGAPRDEAAALRWFREAAEFGVSDSQYNAGVLYQQGRGVAPDPQEALFWFLIAARSRDADAIDRAVEVAASLSPEEVADVRERARAFRSRAPIASANEADT